MAVTLEEMRARAAEQKETAKEAKRKKKDAPLPPPQTPACLFFPCLPEPKSRWRATVPGSDPPQEVEFAVENAWLDDIFTQTGWVYVNHQGHIGKRPMWLPLPTYEPDTRHRQEALVPEALDYEEEPDGWLD